MARILAAALALLHAANIADCCCGYFCTTPNEVCRDNPLRSEAEDTGAC
jgi:hypothetical protein